MNPDEIEIAAKKDGILDKYALEEKLLALRAMGWQILKCIYYVKCNQNCTLNAAKTIVVNSAAWMERKDAFLKHQEEMQQEFMEAALEEQKQQFNKFYIIPKK